MEARRILLAEAERMLIWATENGFAQTLGLSIPVKFNPPGAFSLTESGNSSDDSFEPLGLRREPSFQTSSGTLTSSHSHSGLLSSVRSASPPPSPPRTPAPAAAIAFHTLPPAHWHPWIGYAYVEHAGDGSRTWPPPHLQGAVQAAALAFADKARADVPPALPREEPAAPASAASNGGWDPFSSRVPFGGPAPAEDHLSMSVFARDRRPARPITAPGDRPDRAPAAASAERNTPEPGPDRAPVWPSQHGPTIAVPSRAPDFLACHVCNDIYLDPVTLPCGHSFCRHCVLAHVRRRDYSCPTCCEGILISVEGIGVNISLQKVVEVFTAHRL